MQPSRWAFVLAAPLLVSACADHAPYSTEPIALTESVAFAKAPPTGDIPVVSSLGAGSIQSDQLGAYTNGSGGVSSILQGIGDWVLDLSGRRSTRSAHVDLSDSLPGNPGAAPFQSALVQPRFIAKSSEQAAGGMRAMVGVGSTMQSPLSLAFTYGGQSYGLRMNPVNHAQTDWATVTCEAVVDPQNPATSACRQWRITPAGNYGGAVKNVAYLERITSSGSFAVGNYYVRFDIVVAN